MGWLEGWTACVFTTPWTEPPDREEALGENLPQNQFDVQPRCNYPDRLLQPQTRRAHADCRKLTYSSTYVSVPIDRCYSSMARRWALKIPRQELTVKHLGIQTAFYNGDISWLLSRVVKLTSSRRGFTWVESCQPDKLFPGGHLEKKETGMNPSLPTK